MRGASLAASLSTYLLVRVTQTTNVEILYHAQVTELKGETVLSEVEISDMRDGSKRLIPTRRLFVCIGGVPNTEWAKDTAIVRDEAGYLVTGTRPAAPGPHAGVLAARANTLFLRDQRARFVRCRGCTARLGQARGVRRGGRRHGRDLRAPLLGGNRPERVIP